jgi:MoaA/NifB/PqqE/SkfB family radical SAM enzyme
VTDARLSGSEEAIMSGDPLNGSARFAGLGLSALKSNFVSLPHPYNLNFAITYRCQSRCKTCNLWQRKPDRELSIGEIREFARKNPHFRWISLTGGEPFLRGDIVEIAEAFMKGSRGLYMLTIPTNSLSSLDLLLKRIGGILDLGVPRLVITVSLDGYRELHDEIRGVPGSFDRAVALARALRGMQGERANLFWVFGYTISRHNVGMLERTYEAVRKELPGLTRDDFHVNVAQASEVYYNNTGLDLQAERGAVAKELRSFIGKRRVGSDPMSLIEGVFLRKLVRYVETGKAPMRSRSLDASLFLDSQGNVFPSIMWNRRIGSIRDTGYDLEPLLKGAEAKAARDIIRRGKEPGAWTACEAYQSIAGNLPSFASLLLPP